MKLSVAPLLILMATLTISWYVHCRACAARTLESARMFQVAFSETTAAGFSRLAMSQDHIAAFGLIAEGSRGVGEGSETRLISHATGATAVSASGGGYPSMEMADRLCAVCHAEGRLDVPNAEVVAEVVDRADGERVLSVMAPIANESGCRSAACHAHAGGLSVLAFVRADHPVQPVMAVTADDWILLVGTVVLATLLSVALLRMAFGRLVATPIGELVVGMNRVAQGRFDHRIARIHDDEIGDLGESYNTMVDKVRAHRDELWSVTEYLGSVVESSADIIITVTPEGFIETFNRGAENVLEYSRAEVIGRPTEMLFADPHERDVAIAQLQGTDHVRNYETRFLTKSGKIRTVLLTMSRLKDRNGDPMGTFGISKDITGEKKLQAQLLQSQKFAAIGQAVTGIQHAIRNLLNALKGGAYLFRDGMAGDDRKQVEEGWAMIEEGIDRIRDLSDHMLFYAKEWKPQLQNVDLNALVVGLCELNRKSAAEEGVTLRAETFDALPRVSCDPGLIHMATTDILVNAIDACKWKDYDSSEVPEIVLRNSVAEGGDVCVIEIRDNGCGMDEDILNNIFTPFFSTKKTRGTGLGLALTARFIDVHNGEVCVESEPDKGSAFRIHLPIDGPRGEQEATDGQADSLG